MNSLVIPHETRANDLIAGEALDAAIAAWNSQTSWDYSSDGLEAACWAFHEHMMANKAAALRPISPRAKDDR
jgi:hypothetical protein